MAPKPATAAPPWAGMRGTKRVMAEFKYLTKQVGGPCDGSIHMLTWQQLQSLTLV